MVACVSPWTYRSVSSLRTSRRPGSVRTASSRRPGRLYGLGVLLRVVTFALNFPLWGDEAFVAVNFITRGYRDLLRPLDYGQICPLLFLWLELTAVKLFGFSEWSLRLIPTLCSVASVFLFAHVAGRVTRGTARLLAVGIFSVAYYPIRSRSGGQTVRDGPAGRLDPACAGDRVVEDAGKEAAGSGPLWLPSR